MGCPRCSSQKLFKDQDKFGRQEEFCVMCGYRRDVDQLPRFSVMLAVCRVLSPAPSPLTFTEIRSQCRSVDYGTLKVTVSRLKGAGLILDRFGGQEKPSGYVLTRKGWQWLASQSGKYAVNNTHKDAQEDKGHSDIQQVQKP